MAPARVESCSRPDQVPLVPAERDSSGPGEHDGWGRGQRGGASGGVRWTCAVCMSEVLGVGDGIQLDVEPAPSAQGVPWSDGVAAAGVQMAHRRSCPARFRPDGGDTTHALVDPCQHDKCWRPSSIGSMEPFVPPRKGRHKGAAAGHAVGSSMYSADRVISRPFHRGRPRVSGPARPPSHPDRPSCAHRQLTSIGGLASDDLAQCQQVQHPGSVQWPANRPDLLSVRVARQRVVSAVRRNARPRPATSPVASGRPVSSPQIHIVRHT